MRDLRPPLLILCGPTAAGKTALALELAHHFPLEIVSADSRQVYRGMDIGTAKASPEEQAGVPHHLLDVAEPNEAFTAGRFAELAHAAIGAILERRGCPALVGGTGLYIQVLTEGLVEAPGGDPELRRALLAQEQAEGPGSLYRQLQAADPPTAARLFPRDLVRIVRALEVHRLSGRPLSALQQAHGFRDQPYRTLKLGVHVEREELYRRIDRRAGAMLTGGLLEETAALLARGCRPESRALQTIGYREALACLRGEASEDETVAAIAQATRRYAKRQLTWLRRDHSIIWVDYWRESARILSLIENFYAA
jgi:tRNA dimethylallyltransferase